MDLILSKEAHDLKSLTTLEKYHVLNALHCNYEIKNLSEFGVSAEDRGTLTLVELINKYPIFENKFIVAICEAVESFDAKQLEDAYEDYERKCDQGAGLQFIKNSIEMKKGK